MLEFTVFIRVKIDNLKELSRLMPEMVNREARINRDIIKIKTDMKYLFISLSSNFELEKSSLFIKTLRGLV